MNWKRALMGMAIAIPIIALLGFGLTRDPREIPSPLPGRPAPAFALPVMRAGDVVRPPQVGDTVRLGEHAGDVVVVNFWASWCLACREEHRVLSDVAARYRDKDVHFYGVLYQDSPANGRVWIAEMGGQSYPSLDDPRSRTAINFGLYGVPETFFIARDGRVAFKQVGPVTERLLTTKVDSLLAESRGAGGKIPSDSSTADSARTWQVPARGSDR